MTMRLSIISFAGIVRTLVAVGTVRLAPCSPRASWACPCSDGDLVLFGGARPRRGGRGRRAPAPGSAAGLRGRAVVRAIGLRADDGDRRRDRVRARGRLRRRAARRRRRPVLRRGAGACAGASAACGPPCAAPSSVVDRVVGLEDRPPRLVDGVLVDVVLLVHLVDEPFVGSELAFVSRPDAGHLARHSSIAYFHREDLRSCRAIDALTHDC